MPTKKVKKTPLRKKQVPLGHHLNTAVKKPVVYSSNGPSYDTQMLITILLLVFVYPLGIIFMWIWMKNWANWLKIIISLPLLISVLFMAIIFIVIGKSIQY